MSSFFKQQPDAANCYHMIGHGRGEIREGLGGGGRLFHQLLEEHGKKGLNNRID